MFCRLVDCLRTEPMVKSQPGVIKVKDHFMTSSHLLGTTIGTCQSSSFSREALLLGATYTSRTLRPRSLLVIGLHGSRGNGSVNGKRADEGRKMKTDAGLVDAL